MNCLGHSGVLMGQKRLPMPPAIDVYKRQSLGWGWTRTVNCMRNNRVHANLIHHYAKHMYDVAGIYTLGSQPVSYTHLDVYKRQGMRWQTVSAA